MTRVLVVDDSAAVREMLAIMLERLGYHAVSVASCREALEKLGRPWPGPVIADLHLADGEGLSLAEAAQKAGSAGLIVMSGTSSPAMLRRVRAVGALAFLSKPFRLADLEQALQTVPTTLSRPGRGRRSSKAR